MKRRLLYTLVIAITVMTALSRYYGPLQETGVPPSPYAGADQWPDFSQPADPAIEQRVDQILADMTLHQKVGQMTQAEITKVTPELAGRYALGSVLSGGGGWPNRRPSHTRQDWLDLADRYWDASIGSDTGIPLLWGVDAVHGHNNARGATLFPHNIALGATGNPDLVQQIAQATAAQVRATGLDWTFAPTVAVADSPAWGRTYESYSQDPDAVYHYARAAVSGYQARSPETGILATAKHFIGDGATKNGDDQGDAWVSESTLIERHAQGFYGALDADVQVIMASFSSWWTKRLHGHKYLLTDVLKTQMGFDGFVISDWNGITDVYRCLPTYCPEAINAGIDMVMVPSGWKGFIENTVTAVEAGDIPLARIDDAVRRILRVKLRAGLFDQVRPSGRPGATDAATLNSPELNELAREAVRQSAVLLKNNDGTLPLDPGGHYLVTGRSDHIATQAGGWSLNWQGGAYDNTFFGPSATLYDGLQEWISEGDGTLTKKTPPPGEPHNLDAAIVVLSERSYAEGAGDLTTWQSWAAARQLSFKGAEQLALIRERYPELPVVAVYIGGRPLWMNPQINAADAFVVGWLPGTQGAGLADGLFGKSRYTGRLPFNWPDDDCEGFPRNSRRAAFPIGYGLSLSDRVELPELSERPAIEWGTNGLAPDCVWQRHLLSPFH